VQKKNFQPQKFKNKNKYGIKEKFDGKNKTSHSTKFKKKTAKKKGVWHQARAATCAKRASCTGPRN
jgi:hypothetical protein